MEFRYRDLAWVLEGIPSELKAELDIPFADLDTLISRLDLELSLNNHRLESRIYALIKSRMLMDRLNEAIDFLKTKPDEGELMYQIIYYTFIGEKMNSVYDILNKIGIAKTRYY